MHVLLLSYYFPPDRAVGAIRPAKVARALQAAGHRVTVLTATIPGQPTDRPSAVREFEVRRIAPIPNPRELLLQFKRRWGTAPKAGGSADPSTSGGAAAPPTGTLKRWAHSLMWLPDDRQGFILPAVAHGLLLARHGIDLIYTTAPPFSVHLAGLGLKLLARVPWAAEFRDPWTDNPWRPAYIRSRFSDAAERWLEARCLDHADRVVAVTEGIDRLLAPKCPPAADGGRRSLVVRNGIDHLQPPAAHVSDGVFRIVHIGTFYHSRDPRTFLRAAARLRGRLGMPGVRVEIQLVGDCRWFNEVSVEEETRRLGLADVVRFIDWIPHEQIHEILAEADLLLLLAQNQPDQVPNKLYEYLGAGRPILAFADAEGETARMLRQVPGHYIVADGSEDAAATALLDAARRRTAGEPAAVSTDLLASWTTQAQFARLLEVLQDQDGDRWAGSTTH